MSSDLKEGIATLARAARKNMVGEGVLSCRYNEISKLQFIGAGGQAEVHIASYNEQVVAVKEYKISSTGIKEAIQNEVSVLKRLSHPNIVKTM